MIGDGRLRHNDYLFAKAHRRVNDRGRPKLEEIPTFTGFDGIERYPCKGCGSPRPVSEYRSINEGEPGACLCRRCRA